MPAVACVLVAGAAVRIVAVVLLLVAADVVLAVLVEVALLLVAAHCTSPRGLNERTAKGFPEPGTGSISRGGSTRICLICGCNSSLYIGRSTSTGTSTR